MIVAENSTPVLCHRLVSEWPIDLDPLRRPIITCLFFLISILNQFNLICLRCKRSNRHRDDNTFSRTAANEAGTRRVEFHPERNSKNWWRLAESVRSDLLSLMPFFCFFERKCFQASTQAKNHSITTLYRALAFCCRFRVAMVTPALPEWT